MKGMKIKSLVLLTFIGDMIVITSSYFLVTYFKNMLVGSNIDIFTSVLAFLPIAGIIFFILMKSYDMYSNIFYRSISDIVATLGLIIFISAVVGTIMTFFFGNFVFPRSIVFYSGIYQWIMLSIWRSVIWRLRTSVIKRQKILVLADEDEAKSITEKIMLNQSHLFDIKFIYLMENGENGLYELIDSVDHVIIGSYVKNRIINSINRYCMEKGKNVFMIPSLVSINLNKANLVQIDDLPMFNLSRFGLSFDQKLMKRGFDIIISTVGLIVASPIMLVAVIIIKMDSKGPVFFKQERVTENCKIFNVYKFRTMVKDAEKMTGPVLATDKDPRITKFGRFMRATRIDELPQIFNVFNGSMSIVGPRPERQFFIDQYLKTTPEFAFRTSVKAGITGLAQVSGKYTTTFEDKLRYDLMYIRNYSFLVDVKILLKTVKVVFTKEASAGVSDGDVFEQLLRAHNKLAIPRIYGYEFKEREGRGSGNYSSLGDIEKIARKTMKDMAK